MHIRYCFINEFKNHGNYQRAGIGLQFISLWKTGGGWWWENIISGEYRAYYAQQYGESFGKGMKN